jgi:hypothetical protein
VGKVAYNLIPIYLFVIGSDTPAGEPIAVSSSDAGDTSDGSDIATGATLKPVTYTHVHASFQSMSSTNISALNVLNANKRMILPKERGQGAYKQKWVIEYNKVYQLYLSSYGSHTTN